MTNSVGTQIQGMNSSIVKLHETNEKMKEEGENKFNKIDERFKDMEKKMMDLDKKYENRSDDERNGSVIANQGETVIAGLHKETTESEVADTLKEMIKRNWNGLRESETCLSCQTNHACLRLFRERQRKEQVHQVGKHAKKRIKRKKDQNNEIDGSRRKILQQENRIRQKLHQ